MREPLADYFLYIHVYKKRRDGTFAAVAIIWRRGRRGPLKDGQMAHLVEARSFGTADLKQHAIDAYALPHGHFPGVPAASLQLVAPGSIVVPRAELLRLLVDQTNNRVVTPQVDGVGNPVFDAHGNQQFVIPAGPDLIVDLQDLQEQLSVHL